MENENMNTNLEETEELLDEAMEATEETETPAELISRKVQEIKDFYRTTADRLANDWKETNGNPYIRQTCNYKVEILRSPEDDAPVDTFETTNVKAYSARALAIASGVAAALFLATGSFVRRLGK